MLSFHEFYFHQFYWIPKQYFVLGFLSLSMQRIAVFSGWFECSVIWTTCCYFIAVWTASSQYSIVLRSCLQLFSYLNLSFQCLLFVEFCFLLFELFCVFFICSSSLMWCLIVYLLPWFLFSFYLQPIYMLMHDKAVAKSV